MGDDLEQSICSLLGDGQHPSAWELLDKLEAIHGRVSASDLNNALSLLRTSKAATESHREYLRWLVDAPDLHLALAREHPSHGVFESPMDDLFHSDSSYSSPEAFRETIELMGKFRGYSPLNVAFARLQNPTTGFFATQKEWQNQYGRTIVEGARPIVIPVPKQQPLLVYALNQTEGIPLPAQTQRLEQAGSDWDPGVLEKTVENAKGRDLIHIKYKHLPSDRGGFSTYLTTDPDYKMCVVVQNSLGSSLKYPILCRELAHIYMGHLGSDPDGWWPARRNLSRLTINIEAEAVAHIVCCRAGLNGACPGYSSRYLAGGEVPASLSLNLIASVAETIEKMGQRRLGIRRTG